MGTKSPEKLEIKAHIRISEPFTCSMSHLLCIFEAISRCLTSKQQAYEKRMWP